MDNRSLASLSDRLFGQILDSLVAIVGFLIAGILAAISPTIGGVAIIIAVIFAVFYILSPMVSRAGRVTGNGSSTRRLSMRPPASHAPMEKHSFGICSSPCSA